MSVLRSALLFQITALILTLYFASQTNFNDFHFLTQLSRGGTVSLGQRYQISYATFYHERHIQEPTCHWLIGNTPITTFRKAEPVYQSVLQRSMFKRHVTRYSDMIYCSVHFRLVGCGAIEETVRFYVKGQEWRGDGRWDDFTTEYRNTTLKDLLDKPKEPSVRHTPQHLKQNGHVTFTCEANVGITDLTPTMHLEHGDDIIALEVSTPIVTSPPKLPCIKIKTIEASAELERDLQGYVLVCEVLGFNPTLRTNHRLVNATTNHPHIFEEATLFIVIIVPIVLGIVIAAVGVYRLRKRQLHNHQTDGRRMGMDYGCSDEDVNNSNYWKNINNSSNNNNSSDKNYDNAIYEETLDMHVPIPYTGIHTGIPSMQVSHLSSLGQSDSYDDHSHIHDDAGSMIPSIRPLGHTDTYGGRDMHSRRNTDSGRTNDSTTTERPIDLSLITLNLMKSS